MIRLRPTFGRLPVVGLMVLLLTLGACGGGGDGDQPIDNGSGASSAEEAVSQLLESLTEGEFGPVASLAVPGQAGLASVAEGATVGDVADALRDGDALIAANFWSGFAQSVEPWLGQGIEVIGSEEQEVEGTTFSVVTVRTPDGVERSFITRDVDGHRVDLFATFGPSLATRLYPEIERLLGSPDADAGLILSEMREQVPSLHMAAATPNLAPNVVQDLFQLIELITRIN